MVRSERKSIRLKNYDYSSDGLYFITICTHERLNFFTTYPKLKQFVHDQWTLLPQHFTNVQLDEFVVMPNHIHAIIVIQNHNPRGRGLIYQTHQIKLGDIIRYFKAKCAKLIHDDFCENFRWQRNYHEHIIRSSSDLIQAREYIRNNPNNWKFDINNISDGRDKSRPYITEL